MREQVIAQGRDPDEFPILREEDRPTVFRDVEWVWEGFAFLSGSRIMGYASPQPLAVQDMLAYLDYRGITDPDERDEFLFLVQSLDRQFVAHAIAKSKSQSPTPPSGKPKPR
jgi:hypothetical protein